MSLFLMSTLSSFDFPFL